MAAFGLEYLLLFGPPENKLELLDGKTPCSFPFIDRDLADEHFDSWTAALARWQNTSEPPARVIDSRLVKEIGEFKLEQYRRPIRLEVPSDLDGFDWAHRSFWDRGLWSMQPEGFESGLEYAQDHWDIKLNLWNIFRDAQERFGFEGYGIGGVDLCLTDADMVQPDFFFFDGPKKQHLVADQYFRGVPQLVMEVLSPFSRSLDRGPRKEIYRRAGVSELWLIEPLTRKMELYRLAQGEYHLETTAGVGDELPVRELDGMTVTADRVFNTQSSRFESETVTSVKPTPAWGIARDRAIGLQHLILLGHAERRREIWNNQSPCFIAFGSPEEARQRLDRFVMEAGRWTGEEISGPVEIEPGVETADVGIFHFIRRGHIVRLNVDVSGSLYRTLLEMTADRAAWDWGDTDRRA